MAEYAHRPHGHRGGGGNFRKRRYRDDDDFDRRHQRRRVEEPVHSKLRKRLLMLAESMSRKPEDEIAELSQLISNNYKDEDTKRVFVEVLTQLVIEQPLKIPFLAALILAVNSQAADLVGEVLTKCGEILELQISSGAWREAKLVLRFFACLQSILNEDGIFPLLEQLFTRAVDLQTASSEDGLGLELVKIILLTIAFAMAAKPSGFESRAAALLEKTDIVASTPHALEALVAPAITGLASAPTRSVIGLLQTQMQREAEQGWALKCIPRLSSHLSESATGEAIKHNFPPVKIPPTVYSNVRPLLPEVYFSIYTNSEIETVPPIDNIASSVIRDVIIDTINILDFNRNAAAKCLIDIDCYFSPDTFAARATPFDKLREAAGDGSTWKPEDVCVDAVFSQLLKLPHPEHKLVYYHSVLTEVCKLAPAAIAPSLGRAIRFFYRGLDDVDLELTFRFMDWFSHHLSNFGFTWKWTEWVEDVSLPSTDVHKAFIVGALEKEIRLSVAQRIRGTLPEAYHILVGEEKDNDTPDFKYSDPAHPYSTQAQELVRLLRSKAAEAEIEEQMAAIRDAAVAVEGADPVVTSADVLVTVLCFAGATSISHTLSLVERNKERLLSLGAAEGPTRQQMLSSVLAYWAARPGVGIALVDKLLNYGVFTPGTVVEWTCIHQLRGGELLSEPHVYEMVASTLQKVTRRLRQLVTARLQPDLTATQVEICDKSLAAEQTQVRQLFATVEDATRGVAEGSADGLADHAKTNNGTAAERDPDQVAVLRRWGARWRRVFTRRLAIEEAWARESLATAPPAMTGQVNTG